MFLKPKVDRSSDDVAELNLPAFGKNTEFDVGIVWNCDLKEGLTSPPSVVLVFCRRWVASPAPFERRRRWAIKRWDAGDAGGFGRPLTREAFGKSVLLGQTLAHDIQRCESGLFCSHRTLFKLLRRGFQSRSQQSPTRFATTSRLSGSH